MSNCHQHEVVGRGSETQLQVGGDFRVRHLIGSFGQEQLKSTVLVILNSLGFIPKSGSV